MLLITDQAKGHQHGSKPAERNRMKFLHIILSTARAIGVKSSFDPVPRQKNKTKTDQAKGHQYGSEPAERNRMKFYI